MTQYVSRSFADLKGKTIGLLEVGDIARRVPELAWQTTCHRCGTKSVEKHSAFVYGSARCKAGHCGKTPIKPGGTSGAQIATVATPVRSADSDSARDFQRQQKQPLTAIDREVLRYDRELAARRAKATEAERQQIERAKRDHQRFVRHSVLVWGRTINEIIGLGDWLRLGEHGQQQLLRLIDEEKIRCVNESA